MDLVVCNNINVTILTTTYNRAYILPRLYESLLRQSDKRFEWVIVDDGSQDNTKEVVDSFETSDFLIRYIYKENGGKHTAINCGMKYIDAEYTFIVDSDDYLKDNAIELIYQWIDEIAGMAEFAGVAGVRVSDNNSNHIIGQFADNCDYIDCLNSERRQKKLMGDKAEVYKTQLLKQFPFPEYKDEKFIPESVVWNKFSLMGFKVRWHKEGLIVCEYLEDGLTSATKDISHFRNNLKGYSDDCVLSLKVLKFPYNYSAGSVFYAKCIASKQTEKCMDKFDITYLDKSLMKLFGIIRYKIGRY